jgi:two-component system chemotaxis response regulator CheY
MSKKILVVDDAMFMRAILRNILIPEGYTIVEASNGNMAVERYKETLPDLVTLDITMPDMDGLEALKHLKRIDPGAKVIMCSAMGQQAMVLEAVASGAKDFIVKPFEKDRVLEAIRRALS